jgi:hypothetical protein
MVKRSARQKLDFAEDELGRARRAAELFHCARDLALKRGMAGPQDVVAAVGLITIQMATRGSPKEKPGHSMPGAVGKWLPYNLQVFQRTELVLCIDHNVADDIIEPERRWNTTYELCGCDRIGTCKQGHIMPQTDQFVSQVGYDAFGTSIQPWWHALDDRRNLRNFHWNLRHFAEALSR